MRSIMPIIHAAYARQPMEVAFWYQPFDVNTVAMGHFWDLNDFTDLPQELYDILLETALVQISGCGLDGALS